MFHVKHSFLGLIKRKTFKRKRLLPAFFAKITFLSVDCSKAGKKPLVFLCFFEIHCAFSISYSSRLTSHFSPPLLLLLALCFPSHPSVFLRILLFSFDLINVSRETMGLFFDQYKILLFYKYLRQNIDFFYDLWHNIRRKPCRLQAFGALPLACRSHARVI